MYAGNPVKFCRRCGPKRTQAERDQKRKDRRYKLSLELDPESLTRIELAIVGGIKIAQTRGHDMSTPELDGEPPIDGTRISMCQTCGDAVVVDVMEQWGPYGLSLTRQCGPHDPKPADRRSEYDQPVALATRAQELLTRDAAVSTERKWAWGIDSVEWNNF